MSHDETYELISSHTGRWSYMRAIERLHRVDAGMLISLLWLCRARTNFNSLELMCTMPDDAQVILDAMREGKGQREAARQHMGGGGLISQVVASALGQLPNVIDSSTQEGKHCLC